VAPIPLLDLDGRWEVLPKWQLQARYRWLSANGNDAKGSLTDWRAGVQWQYSQHLAVGLHYRSFNVSVDSSSTNHPGALRLDYKGLQLGVRASM
jgi:phosphate-selective porin